jgi:hypothetical protein
MTTVRLESLLDCAALRLLGLLPKLLLERIAHPSVLGRGHGAFVGGTGKTLSHRDDVDVEKLARKDFRRLRRSARRLESQTDAELHKTRIRGKRARYSAELAGRSRGKKASRFVKAAKTFQDVLGDHEGRAWLH